ncbi:MULTISPECIES: amino acid ABC transporter substrate-binding protein [Nonlabens]|uniref:Amino acid/amide ABC transporter substrate-binding protein (HAAT family) n=1 Tax=Nonlabens ulvanivorans TaxID=906888 RepID=A0A084JVU2_NONUL|nr:LysM peptidoglycan-binding domain-containing protein [Nonlabens ulvanivorans]KEZ93076.1 peptidoglycan-binding protein [Nonlabens ulvanivorans]PRX13805.1 amino acid/amide ABC transporter substrate-binding protein (HAAT family) [Nonlabens ulvanivorans]
MKNIILVVFVFFAFAKANATVLQNYKQHVVQKGETVFSIVGKYRINATELTQLNPDIKSGLKEGSILLIPASSNVLTQRKIVEYKKHKVRRRETLYGIAKKYDVTELDIKEANKELYSKGLRKGDRIQIPVFEEVEIPVPVTTPVDEVTTDAPLEDGKYRVMPKDTKFGIATKYGIKVPALESLNPEIKDLHPGMVINVPVIKTVVNDGSVLNEGNAVINKFVNYEVPAKMTMYSLENLTGITEDSLIALNPHIKDGLKLGMNIRIPNSEIGHINVMDSKITGFSNLLDSISNYNPQRFAVMLPLSLNKLGEETSDDALLRKESATRIALDFYSGMTIARDSAQSLGLMVTYDVFDTQKSTSKVNSIINSHDFNSYAAVVGPLLAKNVVEAAKELKSDGIPVISPLTNTDVRLYKNLFQARPDQALLKQKLMDYLVANSEGKNIILVTDSKKPELKNEYLALFPNAKELKPNKDNYIYKQTYINALDSDKDNWVILAVDNEGFITDAISHYSAKAKSHNVTMFGYENYDELELPHMRLGSLKYTYPSINRDSGSENGFSKKYYRKYQITPNAYATRGFDVAMDIILRNASAGNLYDSAMNNGSTSQVENKFNYSKKFMAGYYNESVYLLQYQEDLTIKELD